MANKLLTVFQNLDRTINGTWDKAQTSHNNTYNMSDISDRKSHVIYKASSKEDYEKTKLEMQQNTYLKDRWVKANVDLTVQAFNGLNNIKLMYRDADLMDAFPEIGAALDTMAEESCVPNTHGQIITVHSKSDRVKNILEDLFINRLDIQVIAPMVIRAMCKYGNQFMLLNVDSKLGVMGWRQLPVYEVERLENGIANPYGGAGIGIDIARNNVNDKDLTTKFVWTNETNNRYPFRDWQIAHFRLITNQMYLPYGCLVGDTRIETENGYKEISNISIGDKVWTFNIETQQRELSEVTMFMSKGEKDVYYVGTFHNFIEGTSDHKLLVYENKEFKYKEIGELNEGDLLVIDNSFNKRNNTIKIDKTYPNENEGNLKKSMTWWNDFIEYIPNYVDNDFAKFFGFMVGDGWINDKKKITFATGIYEKFNIEFAEYMSKITNHKYKFNKSISKSSNYEYCQCEINSKCLATILYRMGFVDGFDKKRVPTWVFSATDDIKKSFLNGLMIADGSYNIDKYNVLRCSIELSNEQLVKDLKILVQSLGYKSSKINCRNRIGKTTILRDGSTIITRNNSYYFFYYESLNKQEKKYDIKERLNGGFKTEKVRKIEYVGKRNTYDFSVSNKNSNFFANGIVTHNCSTLNAGRRHFRMLSLMEDMMLIYRLERSVERRVYKIFVGAIDDADVEAYVEDIANNFKRTPVIDPMTGQIDLRKNLLDISQDLFIPVRDASQASPIETLPAAQNLTAIDDIKFVQNKLLTALRIPKSFLNFEETTGDGKNLALMDIRFVRTVNRFQQAFLMEMTKIASIHLYLLGFTDDLTNFTLSMTNPSTQSEQLEIENIQKKVGIIRDAVSDPGNGISVMSLSRALKEIMKWSDKEIQENFEEIRLEKALATELEKTSQIIKKTGIFDNVDRIYGEPGAKYQDDQQQGNQDEMGGMMGGGGGGGLPPMDDGGFGGDIDELGEMGADENGEISGNEGEVPMGGEEGGGEQPPSNEQPPMENLISRKMKPLLNEIRKKDETSFIRTDVYDKSLMINEEFDKIISSIDSFLTEEKDKKKLND